MNKRITDKIIAFTLTASLALGAVSCSKEYNREGPPQTAHTMPSEPSESEVTVANEIEGTYPESLLNDLSFENADPGITADVDVNTIVERGNVNGVDYTFTIDLSKWDGNTSEEQIIMISKLFWQCYPRMYDRFGEVCESPTDITLAIENEGYEIAECAGEFVHIHDMWLSDNPTDYDCLTHEFAHSIQYCWDDYYLEYSSYVERFADYCRFVYAYDKGAYNDDVWTLQSVDVESDRESSVRFLVWLDICYSTPDNDIILKYCNVCKNGFYAPEDWDAAWAEIFDGSELEGMSIDDAWTLYESSDIATMDQVELRQMLPSA